MNRARVRIVGVAIGAMSLGVAACGGPKAGAGSMPAGGDTAATGAAPASAEVAAVAPIDAAGLRRLLADGRGQVMIVNLWATWCAPCLREIPELVRLGDELAPSGLRVIGISLDDADTEEAVETFRKRWFPEFRTYQSSDEWYALVEPLDPNWSSVLPTSFVLDRDGNRVATLTGGQSYETFAAAVEPLL